MKYSLEYIPKVYGLATKNLSQKEVCSELGITTKTFKKWLEFYPLFKQAYETGKETIYTLAHQRAIEMLAATTVVDTETTKTYDETGELKRTVVREFARKIDYSDLITKIIKVDTPISTDFAMPPVFIGMPPQK